MRYKGEVTHQSFLGGILTLAVQVLTTMIVVIGVQKVWMMSDSNITSYPRPVSAEERETLNENGLRFSDFDFNLALQVTVIDGDDNETSKIPEQYARITAKMRAAVND